YAMRRRRRDHFASEAALPSPLPSPFRGGVRRVSRSRSLWRGGASTKSPPRGGASCLPSGAAKRYAVYVGGFAVAPARVLGLSDGAFGSKPLATDGIPDDTLRRA